MNARNWPIAETHEEPCGCQHVKRVESGTRDYSERWERTFQCDGHRRLAAEMRGDE